LDIEFASLKIYTYWQISIF